MGAPTVFGWARSLSIVVPACALLYLCVSMCTPEGASGFDWCASSGLPLFLAFRSLLSMILYFLSPFMRQRHTDLFFQFCWFRMRWLSWVNECAMNVHLGFLERYAFFRTEYSHRVSLFSKLPSSYVYWFGYNYVEETSSFQRLNSTFQSMLQV